MPEITRSLSRKGCPYDNAAAEAAYKIFKREFVMNNTFDSLGYLSPIQFKSSHLAK